MQPAQAARTIELVGDLHELAMPALCVHCGSPAHERTWIEQVFEHYHSDSPRSWSIETVALPFCPACAATHRRELRVVTPLARLGMMYKSSVMIGATCHFALALFFLTRGSLTTTVVAAGFGLLGAACARVAYNQTRHHAVSPATSVSSAFAISEDKSSTFERDRRIYTLRNPHFAAAFIAANSERFWDPASPQALRAASKRSLLIAIVIVLGAAALIWSLYEEYWLN